MLRKWCKIKPVVGGERHYITGALRKSLHVDSFFPSSPHPSPCFLYLHEIGPLNLPRPIMPNETKRLKVVHAHIPPAYCKLPWNLEEGIQELLTLSPQWRISQTKTTAQPRISSHLSCEKRKYMVRYCRSIFKLSLKVLGLPHSILEYEVESQARIFCEFEAFIMQWRKKKKNNEKKHT